MKKIVIVLLLLFSTSANALDLFIGVGGCNSGTTPTVCYAGDHMIVHFGAAKRWKLPRPGWNIEARYDHFSHYDPGELDPRGDLFLQQNTGFIDAWTVNLVYEW